MNTQEIIRQALLLPTDKRQLVADTVVQSLTDSAEFSDEQLTVIEQRLMALDDNKAQLLDGEQVFSHLRQKYGD